MPVTDDDVRTRAVEIQQSLDRLLADTTPAPVGTSGAASSELRSGSTVMVDRARLLQIRQQVTDLIAALNKR